MKHLLIPFLLLSSVPAQADLSHSITSSAQLTVNAAVSQAERIGTSFSISGTGVDVTDGTTAGTLSVGTITSGVYAPGTIAATQNATGGESFSFSQSLTTGDAVPTSAVAVGVIPNFSDVTSHSSGVAGSLSGGVTSAGVVSLVAGGQGTVATGSVVSSIVVD